jgi:predicted MPP superfamily phosphohydrolase
MIRFILLATFLLGINFYAFQALRTISNYGWLMPYRKVLYWIYWLFCIGVLAWVLYLMVQNILGKEVRYQGAFGLLVLMLVPQLVMIVFLVGEDIFRLGKGLCLYLYDVIGKGSSRDVYVESRRIFLSRAAAVTAAIPFAGILHGITAGKYNYKVRKKTLFFEDLPEAFDGFTITQLSDIHSGSFDNPEKVAYGVEMANAQNSDVILFTGDLVNNKASEMEPWMEIFGKLKAPLGKFSVYGNHDYGDYVQWPNDEAKKANLEALAQAHKDIGFDLLRNEHRHIEKQGQRICIAGVENWGLPPFPQYGDLDLTLKDSCDFRVLMSHDPSHWDAEVKKSEKKVHLTLSGHTHGMQFGIEIPGFRWSPVKFKYPRWAGLYEEANKYLYVNRGFGYLAFPGRVGIWPEVTVIELRKGSAT